MNRRSLARAGLGLGIAVTVAASDGVPYRRAADMLYQVVEACVDCHNNHRDSPRDDLEVGEVMGGVVIRIPME